MAGLGVPVNDRATWRDHRIDFVVFGIGGTLAVTFVLWGALAKDSLSRVTTTVLNWIETNFGWAFILSVTGFVLFVLSLAYSRYGKIKLGRDDDEPRFKTLPWLAMMFAAGMGIGLIFYGVSEPLQHFTSPPPGTATPNTDAALETSMATTMFHWALHPWSCYAVVGLAIAYSTHRRGRPQLLSAAFTPLLGARARGPIGKTIDILAIFATLFGSAASLGLSALQIGSGMKAARFITNINTSLLVVVVIVLTAAFILSAISGVERGVQWLAATNGTLALAVALFVFIAGPTVFILNLLPTSLGDYLKDLPEMAARTDATGGQTMAKWLSYHTIFYWAWWISWT
ncbi:MAG: BCCT family transporter, partial [Pseudonocardiaceae bacterium]